MARPVTLFTGQWADLPCEAIIEKAKSFGYDEVEFSCWANQFLSDQADLDHRSAQSFDSALEDSGPERQLKLFLIYARENEPICARIRDNLYLMSQDGLIDPWYDGCLLPSDNWDITIRRRALEADIIVSLVSLAFLNSDYINGVEMNLAMERAEVGAAKLVSVIIEPCSWAGRPFSRFHVIQPGGKPITQHGKYNHACHQVELQLRRLCDQRLIELGRMAA